MVYGLSCESRSLRTQKHVRNQRSHPSNHRNTVFNTFESERSSLSAICSSNGPAEETSAESISFGKVLYHYPKVSNIGLKGGRTSRRFISKSRCTRMFPFGSRDVLFASSTLFSGKNLSTKTTKNGHALARPRSRRRQHLRIVIV